MNFHNVAVLALMFHLWFKLLSALCDRFLEFPKSDRDTIAIFIKGSNWLLFRDYDSKISPTSTCNNAFNEFSMFNQKLH